jgi:hypothetical protein
MLLPQATTPGLHWKMKKSFTRSMLRDQKDFSEIDLKLEIVSSSAKVRA